MIIYKNDGIYIKDIKYHINPSYSANNNCFYIDKQNSEWIIKNFYKSTKLIINTLFKYYNCIVIYE